MSKKKATATSLPLSRTAKIMTSAVGVESVDSDIVALATKATEIFLADFARRAYELSDSNAIEYDDIQKLVHSDPRYDFLIDTTPKRIKFGEALKLIEESKDRDAESQALMKAPPDKSILPETTENIREHSQQETELSPTQQHSPSPESPELPEEEEPDSDHHSDQQDSDEKE